MWKGQTEHHRRSMVVAVGDYREIKEIPYISLHKDDAR